MSKLELEREFLLKEGMDMEKRVFTKVKIEENEEGLAFFLFFIQNKYFLAKNDDDTDEINYDPVSLSKEGALMLPKIQLKY